MIRWKPFEFQGLTYDLSHLHPHILDYSHKGVFLTGHLDYYSHTHRV